MVYIGSADKNLYALDAATGKKKWVFHVGDGIFSGPNALPAADNGVSASPAVANGVVYIASLGATVYALDAISGKVKWSFQIDDNVDASPTVANGMLYIGSLCNLRLCIAIIAAMFCREYCHLSVRMGLPTLW